MVNGEVGQRFNRRHPISRLGLWSKVHREINTRTLYSDPTTARIGGAFLSISEINLVEDWGCGGGGFKDYLRDDITYIGLDGSESKFADKTVDLEDYRSNVDSIFMRNVLEHNPGWRSILNNAMRSFQKRMVLVMFTPWQKKTHTIQSYPNFNDTGVDMIDIGFKRADIIKRFPKDVSHFSVDNIVTKSQYRCEHMFFLWRKS